MSPGFKYLPDEQDKSSYYSKGLTVLQASKIEKPTEHQRVVLIYNTEEWLDKYRKIRYQVFLRDGRICRLCSHTGSADNPLQIDHIKPKSKFPELALDPNNMQVLCKDCNYGKNTRDETDWRK
jgi:5-methylcytosine-specific restriction endonuclease McrA